MGSEPNLTSVKALTLWQPWATFMALGLKRNETRGWPTRHRGSLAIHASTRVDGWGRRGTRTALTEHGLVVLGADDPRHLTHYTVEKASRSGLLLRGPGMAPYLLPLGCVVAIVDIVDVKRTTSLELNPGPLERMLGDYSPGRYAWQTGSLRRLPTRRHRPVLGHQGLWDWPLPDGLVDELPYELRAAS